MMVLAVLQTAVLPRFPILGQTPRVLFLLALSWGLLKGAQEGVIWGFLAGLFQDLFSIAPLGGSSLTYMIAILLVVFINNALPANRFLLPMVFAALGSTVQLALYLLFLTILGFNPTLPLATSLLPLIVLHGVAVLPVYWLLYALDRNFGRRVVEM
jgi:rod shape-determining protein MreD